MWIIFLFSFRWNVCESYDISAVWKLKQWHDKILKYEKELRIL
jgi:hypothetical protein